MKPALHTAANGHLTLKLNELPDAYWCSLADTLIKHHGLQRSGSPVSGLDQQIHPSFVCAEFSLAAGWDSWFGHYLLSESEAGDVFLRQLLDQLQT